MDTVKKVLNAFIGYTGSSENPEQTSMRFTSIILAVISKIIILATLSGHVLPYTDAQVQYVASSLAFVGAVIWWAVGAVRAVVNTIKQKTVTQ